MRHILSGIACFFLLALVPPGAAAQGTGRPGINDSSPEGGIWGIMERYADAMRVRAQTYSPTIREPDSTAAISCFDRSLALASRLGAIFSDAPPHGLLPANRRVFNESGGGGVYNMYAGLGLNNDGDPNMLINIYAGAMANALDTYLGGVGSVATTPTFNNLPGYQVVGEYVSVDGDDGQISTAPFTDPDTGEVVYQITEPDFSEFAARNMNFSGSLGAGLSLNYIVGLTRFARDVGLYLTDSAATPGLAALFTPLDATTGTASLVTTAVNTTLDTLAQFFSTLTAPEILTVGVPAYYAALQAEMEVKDQFYNEVNGPGGLIETYTAQYFDRETGIAWSAASSLTGVAWNEIAEWYRPGLAMDARGEAVGVVEDVPDPVYVGPTGCKTFAQLWGGIASKNLSMDGITGSGPKRALPYYNYSQLVLSSIYNSSREVSHILGANQKVLHRAHRDLVSSLWAPDGAPTYDYQIQLSAEVEAEGVTAVPPNSLSSWRPVPVTTIPEGTPPGEYVNYITGLMP